MGIRIVQIDTFEDLRVECKRVTAEARAKVEPKPEEKEPSELARAIASAWEKSDFGCQKPHVGAILRAIVKNATGEEIKLEAKAGDYSYPALSAVVPLEEAHSHSYPVGEAFLVTEKASDDGRARRGIRPPSSPGNSHYGAWRYATDEEIDKLFDALNKAEERAILDYIQKRLSGD